MMQALRKNTLPIFVFVIFTFVVGTAILATQDALSNRVNTDDTAIAVVNGDSIDRRAYAQQYQNAGGNQELPPSQRVRVKQNAFNELIEMTLLQQDAERLGLETNTDEVLELLRQEPPADVRNSPIFKTNGQFDMAKYYQQLANTNFLSQMTGLYLVQLPVQKLNWIISSAAKSPRAEAIEKADARRQEATLSYVRISPTLFGPDPTSFTEAEVEAYYRENASDYTPAETAVLTYGFLLRQPSHADTLEALEVLESLYLEVESGQSFDELMDTYSQAAQNMRGGPRGSFFDDNAPAMTPEMRAALDTLSVGETAAPFHDPFGYHIVMLDSTRTDEDGTTSYRIKDIRRRVEITPRTETELERKIVAFAEQVRERKGDITAVADTSASIRALTTQPIDITADRVFIDTNLPSFPEIVDFCREADPGDLSDVIEGPGGYYVCRLDRRGPGEPRPLVEVERIVRADMVTARGASQARQLADDIVRRANAGETLEAIAESDTLIRLDVSRPFARATAISGIGKEPAIMGTAFAMDVGEIAGPFEDANGLLFVIRLDERTESLAATAAELAGPSTTGAVDELQTMKSELILSSYLEHLRREASIRDLRPIKAASL